MPPEESLYALLAVPEDATSEDIKRAYYRAIRRDRLNENPERFKRCREAFETLSDPLRRREYDQLRQFGSEVEALIIEAQSCPPQSTDRAISLLKQAAVLAPDVLLPRLLLADSFARAGDYAGAADEYSRLIVRSPRDSGIRLQLARTLMLAGRQEEAREQANLLLEQAPAHKEALLLQADISERLGDTEASESFLRQAVDAAAGPAGGAFEPLLRLYLLMLRSERTNAADRVAEELLASVVDEDDRWRAASRLYDAALEYEESDEPEDATRVLDLLSRLDVPDSEIQTPAAELRERLALARERKLLAADTAVSNAFRSHLLSPETEREPADILLVRLENEIAGNPARFRAMLAHLRARYPGLSREHDDFFQQVEAVVEQWSSRFRVLKPAAPAALKRPRGGCMTLLFAAAGLLVGFILLEWIPFSSILQRLFGR